MTFKRQRAPLPRHRYGRVTDLPPNGWGPEGRRGRPVRPRLPGRRRASEIGGTLPPTELPAATTRELRELCAFPTEAALRQAVPFLEVLVEDPVFLKAQIAPLLKGVGSLENWYVARRHEEEGAYSLQVFVWPGGTGTKVHDHSSWGVYRCVVGSLLETRYERLDDGSRAGHARLKKAWQLRWSPDDGASTVLPGDGGIHSMANLYGDVSVSVHLYGPRTAKRDGRDYDPSRDYVCDRLGD